MRTALTDPARKPCHRRRGVMSVLAMLYLMLFAILAVGFYATTGSNSQVAHNEQRRTRSLGAAESGMEFMRYQLAQMSIPPMTLEQNVLQEVYNDLSVQLDGTANMAGKNVGFIPGQSEINIPANKNEYIKLASDGSRFRVVITPYGRRITVKVVGCYADTTKSSTDRAAVQLSYDTQERPTDFFSNGLASRGTVVIDSKFPTTGSPASHAGILTTSAANPPVTIGSNGQASSLAGDITVVGPNDPSILGGSSVGGSSIVADILANHVEHLDAADTPEFPTPDTSIYKQYATNVYVAGLASYENIIVPPNANPTFDGPTVIKGVVYIQKPNQVKFNGNVSITGVIVTENATVGTLLSNTLSFQGNGNVKEGVESLPDLPQFAGLKKLGGSFVIAPGFDVLFTGNFGSVSGNIVGDKVTIKGSSDVNVTGSIVALKNTLTISNNGILNLIEDKNQPHAGLRFSEHYVPLPTTYDEVKP